MLYNYLIISLRNFRKNLFYLSVNVVSLAIAMAICVVGYFNYRYNETFNSFFDQAPSLYKVHGERLGHRTVGATQAEMATLLRAAGIEAMRYHSERLGIRRTGDGKHQLFQETAAFIDPRFLQYFKMPGSEDRRVAIADENEILLSERLAKQLFGTDQAEGEVLNIVFGDTQQIPMKVGKVIQKLPHNISFHFDILLPIRHYFDWFGVEELDKNALVDATFIYWPGGENNAVQKELDLLLERQGKLSDGLEITNYRLDNVLEWPAIESELFLSRFPGHLHPASVLGTVSSALAILLLACFNFVNTSIAIAGRRLKEIGLRKVLGGQRKQLIVQFLVENSLMILLGLLLALLVLSWLIPLYNSLYQIEMIQLSFIPVSTYLGLVISLLVIVTLLAGAYPAFYLSGLSSLHLFRNKAYLSGKNILGKALLTFQFILCFYNLFSLLIFVENAHFQEHLDRGYAIKKVINIPVNDPQQARLLEQKVGQVPEVMSTASTQGLVGFSVGKVTFSYEGTDYYNSRLRVGTDYLQTLGIQLQKGSWFLSEEATANEIIVNQLFEQQLGGDVLGKTLLIEGKLQKIVGIVADFHVSSIILNNKITPLVISPVPPSDFKYVSVLTSGEAVWEVDAQLESIWYELFPDQLYGGFYQRRVMEAIDRTNQITISINSFIALISLLISALGLYTLISLVALRRIKEIGVRKVLGASRWSVLHLLGKEIYWVLVIAGVLGLSGGYYAIATLLDIIFAYHIKISWWHFLSPVGILSLIVAVSIGYKMYITAKMNPSEQLRME